MSLRGFIFSALLLGVAAGKIAVAEVANKKVLTSIKPLYLITNELIVGTDLQAELLLAAEQSPHHYALKFSDRRKILQAGLLVWLGEDFEPWLEEQKPAEQSLALLTQLQWQDSGHSDHDRGHHGSDSHRHGGGFDPHIWLNPDYGLQIARQINRRLQAQYPAHGDQLQQNLNRFQTTTAEIKAGLVASLTPYRDRPFFVYHDAYRHFVQRYDLNQLGVLSRHEGQQLGLKHLAELKESAKKAGKYCVFTEPQYRGAGLPEFARSTSALLGELDPMGAAAESYGELLQQFSGQLLKCLKQL